MITLLVKEESGRHSTKENPYSKFSFVVNPIDLDDLEVWILTTMLENYSFSARDPYAAAKSSLDVEYRIYIETMLEAIHELAFRLGHELKLELDSNSSRTEQAERRAIDRERFVFMDMRKGCPVYIKKHKQAAEIS